MSSAGFEPSLLRRLQSWTALPFTSPAARACENHPEGRDDHPDGARALGLSAVDAVVVELLDLRGVDGPKIGLVEVRDQVATDMGCVAGGDSGGQMVSALLFGRP